MTASEPRTEVAWRVEYRLPGREWLTWPSPADEAGARDVCDMNRRRPESRLEYRLIRHTAVITDEVIETSTVHHGLHAPHPGPWAGKDDLLLHFSQEHGLLIGPVGKTLDDLARLHDAEHGGTRWQVTWDEKPGEEIL